MWYEFNVQWNICHKTLLACCKWFIVETDTSEQKGNKCILMNQTIYTERLIMGSMCHVYTIKWHIH